MLFDPQQKKPTEDLATTDDFKKESNFVSRWIYLKKYWSLHWLNQKISINSFFFITFSIPKKIN